MKVTSQLFLALLFTSCNVIKLIQLTEAKDESAAEVNRFVRHYRFDYSVFADDSKSWMQKTSTFAVNNDTSKYSYIQLRVFNRDGSLYSAYSQCMGDFNRRNFIDSFPLEKNDYPFVNQQLQFKNELNLLALNTETKNQLLEQANNYKYTFVVYYTIWTHVLSKHVLREVSKVKSKHPNDVLVVFCKYCERYPLILALFLKCKRLLM